MLTFGRRKGISHPSRAVRQILWALIVAFWATMRVSWTAADQPLPSRTNYKLPHPRRLPVPRDRFSLVPKISDIQCTELHSTSSLREYPLKFICYYYADTIAYETVPFD